MSPLRQNIAVVICLLACASLLPGCVGTETSVDAGTVVTDTSDQQDTAVADIPPPPIECSDSAGLALYAERIAPLFDSERSSSCNKCHLAGVELANLVRETPCQTMACMQDQALVDFDDPQSSKVLGWIRRGDPDSELITDAVVKVEHDAFRQWIDWSAECHTEVCGDIQEPCAGGQPVYDPALDPEILLDGCDEQDLVAAFQARVGKWKDRCAHCHSADSPLPPGTDLPQWWAMGDDEASARFTMLNLIAQGSIDVDAPPLSMLLLKPLAEGAGGVEHGGGDKIESRDEEAYRDFHEWIVMYSECRAQAGASELP